ncbi:HNH endonuclease [Arenibaculum pallidiluteum]|uniref:HNH endonuclease n=1 Tax=Arenibaculum pallidiluteum TaxID=2812559 RepID=UPI001A9753ED|nr:HNH endonuclease signature motif containing protein [Arenibaculum pallidiluteum]
MSIDAVRAYITNKVFEPALASPAVSDEVKSTVRNSVRWLNQFRRVGDLLHYMDRFREAPDTPVYTGLKNAGLLTFEDIRDDLLMKFAAFRDERTILEDFVVGQEYRSDDLVIFAEIYDNRSGGILPIGKVGRYKAVFIKATLNGGKYANEWLTAGERLKYFLKSRTNRHSGAIEFKESYIENAAIIEYPDTPIYAFTRPDERSTFTLAGIFRNAGVHTEPDGSKWFDLVLRDQRKNAPARTETQLKEDLEQAVRKARASSRAERKARLDVAPKKPATVTVLAKAFIRNADVIAEVLDRANGTCEGCNESAPFDRRSDGTPYLEVHHKVPLAAGGDDTVENAVALCPNCHRNEHYGAPLWPVEQAMPTKPSS